MMKRLSFSLCVLLFTSVSLPAQSLESILTRMDQAAPNFHAISGDVEMLTYTSILDDKTKEEGTLQMQRLKSGDARAIVKFPSQTIAFLGNIVRIYFPKLHEYQDYEVGKQANLLNQFLLLGFGSSGRELAQSYNITLESSEKVAGRDTSKLLLVPKSRAVLEHLQKAEIWIPADAAYPVQQQFYEPSGNYRKATYTNLQLNPPIQGTLELQLPSKAKRQKP